MGMTTKKWTALLLAVGMILSLAACGAAPEGSVSSEAAVETTAAAEPFLVELTPEQEQARKAAAEVTYAAVSDGGVFTVLRSDGKVLPAFLQHQEMVNYNLGTAILRGTYSWNIEDYLQKHPLSGAEGTLSLEDRTKAFLTVVQQGTYLEYDISNVKGSPWSSEASDGETMSMQEQHDELYEKLFLYYKEMRSEAEHFARVWGWKNIVDVCSLGDTVFGLDDQGKVYVAGPESYYYDDAAQWTDVVDIENGNKSLIGLKSDGTVVAAGQDNYINNGVKSWSGIQKIYVGANSCIGVKEDGSFVVAGDLSSGVDLKPLKGAVSFAIGTGHILGLFPDGTVVASAHRNLADAELDFGQCAVEEWTDIVAIDTGAVSSFGLKSDGTVVVCGGSNYTDEFLAQIAALTDVESLYANPSNSGDKVCGMKKDGSVFALDLLEMGEQKQQFAEEWKDVYKATVGEDHALGLKSDGTAVAYGYNSYGQCDVASWTDLVDADAGTKHSLGLKSDGTAVAVGNDEYGACKVEEWSEIAHIAANEGSIGVSPDGDISGAGAWVKLDDFSQKKIVQVSATRRGSYGVCEDGSVVFAGDVNSGDWQQRGWSDIVKISAELPCGVKSDGTIQLNTNYVLDYDLSDWTDIVDITAENTSVFGLKKDGTVVAAWNANNTDYGQHQVEDWTDITAVAMSYTHTLGLKKDGTVVAAGDNDNGRCDVSGWTDIVAVAADYDNSYGVKSDGTVVIVGGDVNRYNDSGNDAQRFVDEVTGWTDIAALEVCDQGLFGIRKDGSVTFAAAAYRTQDYDFSEVETWTDIVQLSASESHVLGLKKDGTVVAAGDNEYLQCQINGF